MKSPGKSPDSPIGPGRPRSEASGRAILETTRTLVLKHGYSGVTTRMIAEAAGTGKQTIYRRWHGKAELVLDAFVAHAHVRIDLPAAAVPVRQALEGFLMRLFDAFAETGPAVRGLMAYAQGDPEFRTRLFERLIGPRRAALHAVLEAGVARGELPEAADIETTVAAIYGAMWYRLMLDETLDAAFAASLATFAIAGLRQQQRTVSKS